MRTLSRVSVLCVVIAGTTGATTGCDDVSAGQPKDSSAPPQLVHVLVQDARYFLAFPNRGSSLDILDNNATRSCTIVNAATAKDPQLDTCINEFLVDQLAPDVHCLSSGVCNDPLKIPSTGVPVPLSLTLLGAKPDNRDPGGGVQIRLVFDKVLDNSIETVMMDPSKAPGSTDTYAIVPGLVELDDGAGKPVASAMYYDNGGSHEFSADLELVPLGPAIVIKPKASLDAATTYTVKILNPGAIKDRTGNAAVGLGGGALPTTLTFKTEDLTPANAGNFPSDAAGGNGLDFPDFTASDVSITPNEVIQISFFEAFAGDSATVTIKSGCAGAKPIAYAIAATTPRCAPRPIRAAIRSSTSSTATPATSPPASRSIGPPVTARSPSASPTSTASRRSAPTTRSPSPAATRPIRWSIPTSPRNTSPPRSARCDADAQGEEVHAKPSSHRRGCRAARARPAGARRGHGNDRRNRDRSGDEQEARRRHRHRHLAGAAR